VCAENANIQNADLERKIVKPKTIRNIKDKYRESSRWNVGKTLLKE
jgi:hypothetical protein